MKAQSKPHDYGRWITITLMTASALLFGYTYLRAGSVTGGSSNNQVIPTQPLAPLSSVATPPVPGLNNYVADSAAAIRLGKALFWDMQTGSDGIQACATCHFNAGADSRAIDALDPGLNAGDPNFNLGVAIAGGVYPNYHLRAGSPTAGFGGYHDGDFPLHKVADVNNFNVTVSDINDVVGSQGVFSSNFDAIVLGSGVDAQTTTSDQVFSYPDPSNSGAKIDTRRVEPRNTPSAVNAVFNYRNFWDGRARNICNGANPFGDRDTTSHFFKAGTTSATPQAVLVRLQNSALCSQSLGPPLSFMEMSALGRTFRDLGQKLLSVNPLQNTANTTPLGKQLIDPKDSVLGGISKHPKKGLNTSYAAMIQKAFQPKWWQSGLHVCVANQGGAESWIDPAAGQACGAGASEYSQMEYNFSLFWGIAIQMYESTLRADQTPLDQYLAQQKALTLQADNVTSTFDLKLAKSVTPYSVSVIAFNPALDASDQDVFAFDDGNGAIVGAGLTVGLIDYASGKIRLQFNIPPSTAFPTRVAYSVGATPLTQAQLHGLTIFQTKGRCIVCHGGPELTNASVSNVTLRPMERMVMGDLNVRVYDDGFYYVGTRPASDDAGLAGNDGVAGLPLSESEYWRQAVCADPSLVIMIPGRPGDGITAGPLNCSDAIARTGVVKVPGLRNVALTAPYFHNGGQLTLEQVVEFYNRGGDFSNLGGNIQFLDPNIQQLGLTDQEKSDLVDFLRNGLTDARTVNQQAPFDHPELFVPNGHPTDANGYPLPDPAHPGRALDQYLTIPAVGKGGGTPLPTFLQNLAKP